MKKILDMQFIRYANLFNKITKIRTNHCFEYNNTIVFAIPRKFIPRAIGENNKNLRKLNEITNKKIKIVPMPNDIGDIENFVTIITKPVRFKSIEVKEVEAIITATTQSKASLIGRGKVRMNEMQNILEQYFGIKRLRFK
jgi:NusA-like KH domain protein